MADHDYMIGGWTDKYIITKKSGNPVDPDAKYFVLRFDEDPHARKALLAYAASIELENPRFARDIFIKLRPWAGYEWIDAVAHFIHYMNIPANKLTIERNRLMNQKDEVTDG